MRSSLHTPVYVLLSGGLDSSACLHFYSSRGYRTSAFFVDFGQVSAPREAIAAEAISKHFSVALHRLQLDCGKRFGLGEILGRNCMMVFAALMAMPTRSGIVAIGIHSGTSYFDCSAGFVTSAQELLDGYASGTIRLGVPFLKWTKGEILAYHREYSLPTRLTYSCELGLDQPCGKCSKCLDAEMYNDR